MKRGKRFYSDAARWLKLLRAPITRGPRAIKVRGGGKFNHDQENARRLRQIAAGTLQMHRTP